MTADPQTLLDGRPPWRAALLLARVPFSTLNTAREPGLPVEPGRFPALESLVLDVAGRTGTVPPSRVWLTGEAKVSGMVAGRQRYLTVGLPLLRCMTAGELAVLIGRELSILDQPYPWLATRLFARWVETAEIAAEPDLLPRRRRRAARRLAAIGAFGPLVRDRADEAGVRAAGDRSTAARALVLARLAEYEYWAYQVDAQAFEERMWLDLPRAVVDVDDGWQRLLRHGIPDQNCEEEVALVTALHPAFAAEAAAEVTLEPRGEVDIGPLTVEDERRLIRRARQLRTGKVVRWTRFADIPEDRWIDRAQREAAHLHSTDELTPLGVAILVEEALLPRGWRLEHPAVRGVLIGPEGQRVDAGNLAERAGSDPGARDQLEALAGPQVAAAATAAATSARSVGSDQGPTR